MILKNILPLVFAYLIGQAPAVLEHHNRVIYGDINTGARFEQVMAHHDGFNEKLSGNFVELETRSGTDTSINVKRPPAMDVYDRFSVKMPVKIYESQKPNRCDAPSQMVFIAFPPRDDGKTTYRLFSYNYMVCAGGGEVSPSRLFEKYMEKYGSYDEKDYDRNMHIYNNVNKTFRVGVTPTKMENSAGLLISVTDDLVFKRAYKKWRLHVRKVEEGSKEKF